MKTRSVRQFEISATICACVVVMWIGSALVKAQSTSGSIYGTVNDTTGAVIPNATVTAKSSLNGFTDTERSNASGDYVFPVLAPGTYVVSATAGGFGTITQKGIILAANQNVHVIFALSAGSTTQTVTVAAATTMVDTVGSDLGSTIDQGRLENLPLNGRDAYDLIQISPGVTGYSEGQSSSGGLIGDISGVTFSTNGLPIYNNSYYLDGANDTSFFRPGGNYSPNPDALQEFRVLTSNSDAEFGAMPGAVVNMITRSGANQFHGMAYDYLRNNIFNSRTEFVTGPATHLRQNQFGGNFGGPVYRNKLFFFFSYQGLRIATNAVVPAGSSIVPTQAERMGDFTADSKKPTCGPSSFPCVSGATPGLVPSGYLDSVAQNILKFIPLPTSANGVTGGPSPQQTANEPVSSNQYLGRGDYQLSAKHRLSYMYFHEFGSTPNPIAGSQTIIGYAGDLIEDAQTNHVGTDTWTISGNKLNVLRVFYSGNHYASADLYAGQHTLSDEGIMSPCAAVPCTQANVRIAGYIASLGNSGSAPSTYAMTALGAGDTFIWTAGHHTFKFGGTVAENRYISNLVGQRAGIYTISGFASGNPLADFLLGKAGTFSQSNSYPWDTRQVEPALFAQDAWKLTHRLTLDLGLRWEVFPPFHGQHNTGTFEPNVQSTIFTSAPTGILYNGDRGVPDGILVTTYDRFAPRVGFAYDVFGNGKTSVRGGWGLFYSQESTEVSTIFTSPVYNVAVSIANTTNFANPFLNSTVPVDPYPVTPNLTNPTFAAGLTFSALPPNEKVIPYAMEYNLTIEHQLSSAWVARVSYVANGARHLYGLRDENSPVYASTCTATTCGTAATQLARRPYKPSTTSYVFNTIDEYDPALSSNYNSLQAMLIRNFSDGFSFTGSYVWAKDLSDGQDPTKNGGLITAESSYNFSADYGKTYYDVQNRFVASYLWASPDIRRLGAFGREALSSWQLTGITTLSTGMPVNMLSGSDTNYDGVAGSDRPNQVANWKMPGGRSRAAKAAAFFNTAAFASVPVGTSTGLGNTQYGLMFGPGYVDTDFSAAKSFPIWRENAIQFRADAFNLFANVNLSNPTAQLNSPNDGKITSAGPGRIVQLSLKYSF